MKPRKPVIYFLIAIFGLSLSSLTTSCRSKKEGCKIEESLKAPVNKRGQLKTKKGSSNLFDKKSRKKAKKRY